jgi:hypothetical protein
LFSAALIPWEPIMSRHLLPCRLLVLLLGIALPAIARAAVVKAAAPFAGTFTDQRLTLELTESAGAYAGTIKLGDKTYPATARPAASGLDGTFEAGGNKLAFTAVLDGDTLTLVSGKATYTLKRLVNPLEAPAGPGPVNPLSPGPSAGAPQPPAGSGQAPSAGSTGSTSSPQAGSGQAADVETVGSFSVLGSTDSGKTLFIKLPDAHTPEVALTETADALAKMLDGKLSFAGAFLDSRTKKRGGATFSTKLKGQDLRGWMFFSLGTDAAMVSAVYARADAPQTELSALFAALPAQAKMQEHRFPDGSGSVDLPPGWTTESQSLGAPLLVKGPEGQTILTGGSLLISTPDGRLMQLATQNYQMAIKTHDRQSQMQAQIEANWKQRVANNQRQGFPAPPEPVQPKLPPVPQPPDPDRDFPKLIFCHYCATPEEVVRDLDPILQARTKRISGIEFKTDRIIESTPVDPNPGIAGAKAAVYYTAGTRTEGTTVTHVRAIRRIECCPILDGKDTWMVFTNSMAGPDATFDRDRPLMKDIMDSVKLDPEWFARKQKADGDAILKQGREFGEMLFRRGQEFNRQQTEHFNHFEAQMNAQYQARHDANSDFIEMIRGVRDVYDTKTGTLHSVDLYNSHAIVEGMNAAVNDPNQFVQIPLRYER